jgi:outer membrane lipoprotein SlyB
MKSSRSIGTVLLTSVLATTPAWAGDTAEAAIAAGIGGAVGAAVGSELGGRNGAIVGAGVGAAAGAVVATHDDDDDGHKHRREIREAPTDGHVVYVYPDDHDSIFCPPGQAKKGRC